MIPVLAFVIIVSLLVVSQVGVPGSAHHLGWKLSGIWANEADTLQIMMYHSETSVSGYVVSAEVNDFSRRVIVGSRIISDLKLKPSWAWSEGKYVDPFSQQEYQVRVKLVGNDLLKVKYLVTSNGEGAFKEEEWRLVNPL